MSESVERGFSISPVVHVNGSRAYNLRLPFEDDIVRWTVRTMYDLYQLLTTIMAVYCMLP